jgi:molybdopterin converting factor subunit 1
LRIGDFGFWSRRFEVPYGVAALRAFRDNPQSEICNPQSLPPLSYLDSMTRILYFGVARDHAGCSDEAIELERGSTIGGLWDLLVARHPRLAAIRGICRVAADMQYATDDMAVDGVDEIAIIPPVAGG